MKKLLFVLPIILLLAAGCGKSQNVSQQNTPSSSGSSQEQQVNNNNTPSNAQGLKSYSNSKYNFQLSYPSSWVVTENESYISIKPTEKSESNFSIATVNVGRESVFDLAAKVKIQDTVFAGKKAKIYDCHQQASGCPSNISASIAIHLTDLPAGWGRWNEIDYEVYNYENVNVGDFEKILNSIKFTDTANDNEPVGKLYINNRVGYEFKYPAKGLQLPLDETIKYPDTNNPNKDLVQFTIQNTYSVQTYVGAMKNFKSLADWIADAIGTDNNISHYSKQTIGGQEAYLYNDTSIACIGYNGNVYEIVVRSGIAPVPNDNDPTYNLLLDSFKFTN